VRSTSGSGVSISNTYQFVNSSVFSVEPLPLSLFLNKENIAFSIKAKLKDLNFAFLCLIQHQLIVPLHGVLLMFIFPEPMPL